MTQKQGRNKDNSQRPTAAMDFFNLDWHEGLQSASFFKYNVQFAIRLNAYGNGH